MKHIDIAPHLFGCADQGGMAAYGIGALTNQRRLGIGFGRQRRPNQAPAPVIDPLPPRIPRKPLSHHPAPPGQAPSAPLAANGLTSRTELQIATEAASSTISATPKGASVLASAAARWAADAVMPSSRSNVTAVCGEPRSPSPLVSARNTEFGTCAAPDTSNGEPSPAGLPLVAPASPSPSRPRLPSPSALALPLQPPPHSPPSLPPH